MATHKRKKTLSRVESANLARQFWRLVAALVLLAAVCIAKWVAPEPTKAFLQDQFVGQHSFTQLLSSLGERVKAFLPFGEMLPMFNGGTEEETSSTPEVTADESENQINLTPEESYDAENEPPPEESLGIGGFDEPILWVDERYVVLPPTEGEDDTLPLPFGFEKPERADYTVYELPFELETPTEGRLSSSFGFRIHPIYDEWMFHYGIDIANNTGTAIYAAADGVIAECGESASYGKYIIISHEDGYATVYAHLNKITAKKGKSVQLGDKIGLMGATGLATGPHLHFELRKGDSFLNPVSYLPEV